MTRRSKIEWTNATWNPLVGCSRVSRGCQLCYAESMAARVANAAQAFIRSGRTLTDVQEAYLRVVSWKLGGRTRASDLDVAEPRWNGQTAVIPSVLGAPLGWKAPQRIFVNSMSDLFHPSVAFETVAAIYAVVSFTPRHTHQVLTKRPERAAEFDAWFADRCAIPAGADPVDAWATRRYVLTAAAKDAGLDVWAKLGPDVGMHWPLPNLWLGTSVEDRKSAAERVPHLLRCKAGRLWISAEPLLEGLSLAEWLPGLDWVVAGGESGARARPCNPDWVYKLRDECMAVGVPFNFKQWGRWLSRDEMTDRQTEAAWTGPVGKTPWGDAGAQVVPVGKGKAGRLLGGKTYDGYPPPVDPGPVPTSTSTAPRAFVL